jgi:MoaA/NifB/PqqE/SkfB family radical SAM enzyme
MCANTAAFCLNTAGDYRFLKQAGRLERHLRGAAAYRKNARTAGAWNLTGGEPTLNPDFIKVVAYFRRRLKGEELLLLSNGRRLADPAFAAAFAAAAGPPFTLGVSIHGPGAALHDRVAGVKGAFSETMRGLGNLLALPYAPALEIRVILHKLNYSSLGATLGLLKRRLPGCRLVIMHYESEGRGARNEKKLAVKLSATARAVNRCAARVGGFREAGLYHFPLCLLAPRLRRLARVSLPAEDRTYPPACRACRAREKCVGLMKPYLRRFGAAELKPL